MKQFCVLFFIGFFSSCFSQDLKWEVENTGPSSGERVVAVIDASDTGTYDGAGLIGTIIDGRGNWGYNYPEYSRFKLFVNFTQNKFGIIQERLTPNIILKLRKINNSIVHLTAEIPSHRSVTITFRKAVGFSNVSVGNPGALNSNGQLVIEEPDYEIIYTSNFGLGNVGIGTKNPDEKLTVKGNIHAEEVRVDLSVPAPDYVFEKQYDLTSLEELEKYIQTNKHLPEVPAAKDFERDGISTGEMNMLLLKKIEELSLYTIQQHKQAKRQQELLELQAEQIKKITSELLGLRAQLNTSLNE